jgi:hypothetical protein
MTLSESLIGTWRLLSREDRTRSGELRDEPMLGSQPEALLIYDRAGNFAAQFMKRDRSMSPAPAVAKQATNNSTAIGGYDAYFGSYSVDDTTNLVTQRLVAALSPSDVGKVVTREMQIEGSVLVIRIALTAADGERVVRTLRWAREA